VKILNNAILNNAVTSKVEVKLKFFFSGQVMLVLFILLC
jgi:hypothetical protein